MKVLSFEVDGEVYILGTPDYTIAEFDSSMEISKVFKMGLKQIANEDPAFAARVNEAFSFVLRSDPRMQELNKLGDLVERELLPETAIAVLVALKEYDNFVVMSFFKGTEKAKEWHKSGKPFTFRSATTKVREGDFSALKALLRRAIPDTKSTYLSPRMSEIDLAAHKYIPQNDTIH